MKGDFTSSTFNKKKHYRRVNMQQGRVQLDADWNAQIDSVIEAGISFWVIIIDESGKELIKTQSTDLRILLGIKFPGKISNSEAYEATLEHSANKLILRLSKVKRKTDDV